MIFCEWVWPDTEENLSWTFYNVERFPKFVDLDEKSGMLKETDTYEFVQFDADLNKNRDIVDLNEVSLLFVSRITKKYSSISMRLKENQQEST